MESVKKEQLGISIAAKHNLNNLVLIIDYNKIQLYQN